ncbi:RagB/SusD family nutrient uptake outer membrane protein [Pedobacter sp.]|uniref:RagB/SusD family nutrient uptake outer membrane protein n=1 Tax=Pedobacter sp. TaxID=1411316 RepID=UPI0031D0D47F
MKKIFLYNLIFLAMTFCSCKKFLEEYSQDEMRPGSTDDLTALMYSEAYPYVAKMETFDALTDDIQNNALVNVNGVPIPAYLTTLQAASQMFTFNPTMFDAINSNSDPGNLYGTVYLKIKGCNVIIDHLDRVSGTAVEKNAILGQCLFLRGFYYLKLVTTYAKMYNAPGIDPATALGVPLVLSSQVKDGGLTRNSLKEVYDQIEKDLTTAEELLRNNYNPTNAFRIGSDLANGMLSRFYLYRGMAGDYDKAIQAATRALQNRATLTVLASQVAANGSIAANGIYNAASPEVLWVYGGVHPDLLTVNIDSRSLPPFSVSADLIAQYDKGTGTSNYGDLRYQYYFQFFTVSGNRFPYRTAKNTLNAQYGSRGFRVAELYLNRAEAYAQKYLASGDAADRTAALADLNTLRRSRYDTRNTAYTPINITDAQELYKFCQEERRRELALEDGHRFIDLKRWRMDVTHVFTGTDNVTSTYTLPANSPLFALPIPFNIMVANPSLIQNPR